ncbi:sigma-54-dependent Fis family transcriptional regulator [candidate division WOR-3 bacterium]|nr:sigma-54-dependent Fis family transcriptional regulator [candidate division WOR-3 bacterium]
MKLNILIVEDEVNQRKLLKKILSKEGYTVEEAGNGVEGIDLFFRGNFDLVLLDRKLPDKEGVEVLRDIKKINPIIPVIIITAFANVANAVEAMKEGAFHYLTKPIDPEELILIIKNSLDNLNLKRENIELKESLREKFRYDKIIYNSGIMEDLMSLIFRASKSDANVLITGESGTGKELIAGAVHNLSLRNEKLFVTAHIASLAETLIEAELFGHEKGAFTGADKRRIGKFEFASGGTIFLDEIGELPNSVQVKLLRVIEEKKITRIGSNEEIPIDIRLICATNRDIEKEVEKGTFREDLYYRLNVIRIHVPPLRKRKEDIPLLVSNFIKTQGKKEKKDVKGITDEALKKILKYDFPGNVRELENIIKRAVVFSRGDYLTGEDISVPVDKRLKYSGKLNDGVRNLERGMIEEALKKHDWNQSKAAKELGISERTIRYKIGKYKIKKS